VALLRAGDVDGSEQCLIDAVESLPSDPVEREAWLRLVFRGAVWLTEHGEQRAALRVVEEALAGWSATSLDSDLLMAARGLRVHLVSAVGSDADAAEALREFSQAVGDDGPLGLRLEAASALRRVAGQLKSSGDLPGALSLLEDALARLGEQTEPEMRARVAEILNAKARLLADMGDEPRALEVFSDVVRRFRGDDLPDTMAEVAVALEGVAACEANRGEAERASAAYGELLAFSDGWVSEFASEKRFIALRGLVLMALRQGLVDDAVGFAQDLARLAGTGAVVRADAVELLFETANFLQTSHEDQAAIEVLDAIIVLLSGSEDALERGNAGLALHLKAHVLDGQGREDEAGVVSSAGLRNHGQEMLAALDQRIEEAQRAEAGSERRQRLLGALFLKAEVLSELGMTDDLPLVLSRLAEACEGDPGLGAQVRREAQARWPDTFAGS